MMMMMMMMMMFRTGHLINPMDRIQAKQELPVWEAAVAEKAEEVRKDKAYKKATGYKPSETAHAPKIKN